MMEWGYILLTQTVTVAYQVDKIGWVSIVVDLVGVSGHVHLVHAAIIHNSEMDRHQKRLQRICFAGMSHLSRGCVETST